MRRRIRRAAAVLGAGAALGCLFGAGAPRPHTSAEPPSTGATLAASRVISSLSTIAFVSPRLGYGLVMRQTAPCELLVARTTDGGADFGVPVHVAAWRCANGPPATRLVFDGLGDGFLYGPKLFVTHDGGRSWSPDPQPGTVVAIAPLGRSAWMLEGSCPAGVRDYGARVCPLRLLESSDGGRHWAPAPAQPAHALTSRGALTLEPAQGQSWLVRVSARDGYVLTDPMPTSNHPITLVPLWRTDDGGAAWARLSIPCRVAQSVMLSASPGGGTLFAVCAGQPAVGSQSKSTARSDDGGRTWSVGGPCANLNLACGASPLNRGYLGTVVARSPRTVYVTGLRSALIATHDGGASWHDVAALGDFDGAGSPDALVFVDAGHGFALGDDELWRTADGGATWSTIAVGRS